MSFVKSEARLGTGLYRWPTLLLMRSEDITDEENISKKLSQLPFGKVSTYEFKHFGYCPQILVEHQVKPHHNIQGGNSLGRLLTCKRHHFVSPLLVHKVPLS